MTRQKKNNIQELMKNEELHGLHTGMGGGGASIMLEIDVLCRPRGVTYICLVSV